jgi:hypothetical protein
MKILMILIYLICLPLANSEPLGEDPFKLKPKKVDAKDVMKENKGWKNRHRGYAQDSAKHIPWTDLGKHVRCHANGDRVICTFLPSLNK